MRPAIPAALALALPVLGLTGGIVAQEVALRGATEWRIPITGYDPRDPLRGHYINFRYVWAVAGPRRGCDGVDCRLCLQTGGSEVRIVPRGTSCAAPVDPVASALSVSTDGDGRVSAGTRLWVSETSAPVLEAQLRQRPMVAVARLTKDGRLLATRLEPAR